MSITPSGQPPELRMSDVDRDQVVERLRAALGEGRLTLQEFEQRVDQVLAARTFGDVAPVLADLPGSVVPERTQLELRTIASSLKRSGRWRVPRQLLIDTRAGSVKLDFTEAVFTSAIVEVTVDSFAGGIVLVLPPGASIDIDDLVPMAATPKIKDGIATSGGSPHFVVTGTQRAAGFVARRQRSFGRWRW